MNYFTDGIDFIVTALNFGRQSWLIDVNFFRDCELRDGETSAAAKEWCHLRQSTLDCLHVEPGALVLFLARPDTFSCGVAWHFGFWPYFLFCLVVSPLRFQGPFTRHRRRVWPNLRSGKLHSKATSSALRRA